MGIVDARIHDGDHNAGISKGNAPGRRCRYRGRPPLCSLPVMGAAVCRGVGDVVRGEGLDHLHRGVELGELNVGSLAEMLKKGESRLSRSLEMSDSDFIYRTHGLRTEGRVELTQHVLSRCRFKSDQDVAGTYGVCRTAHDRSLTLRRRGGGLRRSHSKHNRYNNGGENGFFHDLVDAYFIRGGVLKHCRLLCRLNFEFPCPPPAATLRDRRTFSSSKGLLAMLRPKSNS